MPNPNGTPTLEEIRAERERRAQSGRSLRTQAAATGQPVSVEAIRAERQRRAADAERQQRQQQADPQVARRAAERHMDRRMAPFGLGHITQPIVNTIRSPSRRAEVARATRRLGDDISQIPKLDWGQLAEDTSQSVQQGVRDLPRTASAIAGNIPQIARAMTYGPFEDEERAQQEVDRAELMGDEAGARAAAARANEATAYAGLNVAAPVLFGGGMSVPRAAGTAAGLSAPFALSRNSDQPLQQRLPGALTEIGAAATFGGGLQGAVNATGALGRILPSRGAQMVQRMDRAGASVDSMGNPVQPRGVTPSFATANNGAGVSSAVTNMVADNIFAGVPSRARLRQSATQLRDAVHDVRDAYGRAQSREAAGRAVQEGLERFASARGIPNPHPHITDPLRIPTRDMSFPSKAELVFNQALRPIEGNRGRLTNTQAQLQALARRADAPAVRAFNADARVTDFTRTVTELTRGGTVTLRDLRELRRGVREAQRRARIGPDTVDNAALRQLESALTRDMMEAAGPMAGRLRQADQYYARGMERIDALRRLVDPNNPSATIQQIIRSANPRTENSRFLLNVRAALPDDQWRMMAASIIEEMGTPPAGAAAFTAEQGFSVAAFSRAYRSMSPRARRILFGSRGGQGGRSGATMNQLADDLDNLAQVAMAQKSVAAGANSSGSATHLQNLASIAFALNPTTTVQTLIGVLGGVLTGEMLTNPAFVRFLVSARGQTGASGGIRGSLARLRDLAARDPALYPAVAALESHLQDPQSSSAPQSADGQALTPPPVEPAYR